MHQPRETHWLAAMRILAYIKSCSGKGWCIGNMNMYAFLDTLIQGMLVIEGTGSLLLTIALLLEEIWWLGGVRNKMLCSLKCWSWVQSYGSYGMRDVVVTKFTDGAWVHAVWTQALCIMIISLPSILPRTQCFMKEPNTLRSIVTLSEMFGPRRWLCSSSHHLRSN